MGHEEEADGKCVQPLTASVDVDVIVSDVTTTSHEVCGLTMHSM